MGPGQRLELKQSQQLVMTPQLQQAIKLLQLSALDVASFVAEEVERNPLLAVDEGEGAATAPAPEPRESVDRQIERADPVAAGEALEAGRDNLYEAAERRQPVASTSAGGDWRDGTAAEERLAEETSLREHLLAQIAMAPGPVEPRRLASLLVDELDDAGYLRADLSALAVRLGARCDVIDAAVAVLQSCDPVGVGARDLAECLALQLKDRNRCDPAMAVLLTRLDDLAAMRFDRLRAACGVDAEDLADMIAEIRALDPRPGAAFGGGVAATVAPDVFVARNEIGGWSVEVNADALPKVLLDTRYAAELNASGDVEARAFLAECRQGADWLIRALDQRAQTILKVASEIVRRQSEFLDRGIAGLRPMTLRAVADEIGMHESTVSRVTANKYLACERGVFEMKFFFTQAIAAADGGDSVSAEAVRLQIKRLIEQEDSKKVLSDDSIVNLLKQSGVNIARRTVAKYREGMNIPSSAKRKRMKAAALAG